MFEIRGMHLPAQVIRMVHIGITSKPTSLDVNYKHDIYNLDMRDYAMTN